MRALKFVAIALLFSCPALAQETPPSPIVKAELAVAAGSDNWAAVTFTMPDDWHIYWRNPGDSGLQTALKFTQLPDGVSAGNILWPVPHRLNTAGIINYGYSHAVTLVVPLKGTSADTKGDIGVYASWLVCKDICIPETAKLTAPLQANEAALDIVRQAMQQVPKALNGSATYTIRDDKVILTVDTPEPLGDGAEFFPIDDGIMANAVAQELLHRGQRYTFTFARGHADPLESWHGVIRSGDKGFEIAASRSEAMPQAPVYLPLILLLAFAGGILLNLMPCVLPILSLKALSLAKKGGAERAQARKQGLSYTAGVIAGFLAIACIMLLLRSAGMAAGWGFQLQQPEVVAGLFVLMLLVALNLFGWFELPVLFGSVSTRINDATLFGSFCTGALAVALATPCTTPFMAPAIGATLFMPAVSALLVFATLGVGMALPFLIISCWPAALRKLPKPGPWMVRFKQWIALPVLATALWLLFVLMQLNATAGLRVALIGAVLIVLLVRLSRSHGGTAGRMFLIAIAAVSLATIALQPPIPSQQNILELLFPGSEPYSEARLKELRDKGTPVLVDVTATWCITCKYNERAALRAESVQEYFTKAGVIMLVADWTRGDEAITRYLASFGRNGVPLYVYYPPGKQPVVLPQLLTPSGVIDALQSAS